MGALPKPAAGAVTAPSTAAACPVAGEGVELVCPRCGLRAPGIRCPRCDAVKLLPCSGDCAACRRASR